jgi:hypothetical protein|tara:strand:+ start:36 stop:539 length:504 start_codon:yes stop_codon:yes gene_type:complete
VFNEIISKKEQSELLRWIFENENIFEENIVSSNRKFLRINSIKKVPELFFDIKKRILEKENIKNYELDPFFGDMVTWNSEGGSIQLHDDPTIPGREHYRFNLFLSKPISGGDPIYNNEKLNFNEREYIKYHVNRYKHMSKPVIGQKPRIVISYGISIDQSTSNLIYY